MIQEIILSVLQDSRYFYVSSVFSTLFILGLAWPSYASLVNMLGKRRGFIILAVLSCFALGFEYQAIKTGWPYGFFEYGEIIGMKINGVVPWTVPFAWVPLVIGAVTMAAKTSHNIVAKIAISACLLVLVDMVLDPGAVAVGFWAWQHPHGFYNVPWSNFFGWGISGVIGASIWFGLVEKYWQYALYSKKMLLSVIIILPGWIIIDYIFGLWWSMVIGIMLEMLFSYYYLHFFSKTD